MNYIDFFKLLSLQSTVTYKYTLFLQCFLPPETHFLRSNTGYIFDG